MRGEFNSLSEAWRVLREAQLGLRAARVLALMLLTSLSEGFGLVLLVPLLSAVAGGGVPSTLRKLLAALHLPVRLGPLLVVFVAVVGVRAAVQYARVIGGDKLSYALSDGLRMRALRLLLGSDWRTLATMRQSDNVNLLLTNPDRIRFAFDQLMTALALAITLGATGLAAFVLSPRAALVVMAAGVLALAFHAGQRRRAVALGEVLGAAYERMFALATEALGALRLIKSLHGEARIESELRQTVREQRAAELSFTRSAQSGQATLQVLAAAALAGAVWLGVEQMGVAASVLLPLVALSARAVPIISALQQAWQSWLHGVPALRETLRLIERLDAERERGAIHAVSAPRLEHAIELQGIDFRHSGADRRTLQAISIRLPARSFTALVGPSGAGKSTLADVIGGLLSPDEGRILIDGLELGPAQRRAWREAVGYVQQEPLLFHASIADNLRWARPDASADHLVRALHAASAGFAFDLDQGLDTVVGDRGSRLSGGERQRIALARALLREPSLLILDEPTSALDAESEATIAKALAELKGRVTILLIAHRGTLTALADHLITLESGRIALPA